MSIREASAREAAEDVPACLRALLGGRELG